MVMFFTMIGDAGLGRSLVRVDDKDSDAWSTAFWGAIILMSALGGVVFLLSWPSAAFFNQPGLVPIMMTLALAPVLLGVVEIPAASLLQKEKFQWLAGAEINRDKNLRLQYMAGMGLNLYENANIYSEIRNFRRYPTQLFVASPENRALLEAVLGPGGDR